jgi:hypothetical protein
MPRIKLRLALVFKYKILFLVAITLKLFLNKNKFAVQYSQCIWDKDTDEMVWYPNEIDVCNSKYNFQFLKIILFVFSIKLILSFLSLFAVFIYIKVLFLIILSIAFYEKIYIWLLFHLSRT